jgi:superfamily I DNA/RNA helicase/mRNA-degrading endonuclease RelE of RelBE toxin-antitoxin system
MNFRIADTFTTSLAHLTGDEQKSVKITVFDLQANPANPGIQLHKLDKAKDKRFWSARVGSDIRLILHRSEDSLLLCYVNHHDTAYRWAERRKLETHPTTGAAQIVEIRETIQEILIPKYVEEEETAPHPTPTHQDQRLKAAPLFADTSDDTLLGYGVPPEWITDVRTATGETLLDLADHLPAEAAEALLELATGSMPQPIAGPPKPDASPFDHPDAQRRFRVFTDLDELQQALDYPWDKWTVFLHPKQRETVDRDQSGPARVSGTAGTGKTIVAIHRAVHLAVTNPESRILLTTFSRPLANALRAKLNILLGTRPRLAERIDVESLDDLGEKLYRVHVSGGQPPRIADRATLRELLKQAAATVPDLRQNLSFLLAEWEAIVDARQLANWDEYRDAPRLGRKTRLAEVQRRLLWDVFARVQTGLKEKGLLTRAGLFAALTKAVSERRNPVYDHIVVDEAQDINIPQLRFLAALGSDAGAPRPNGLFFAGDLGQRIFQLPFSWKSYGVDIRGRARTLRINYRTSHQIRAQADRLLGPEVVDVDGNIEERKGTVSVFNGPVPEIRTFDHSGAEIQAVSKWLKDRNKDGIAPHEIGVFVRSERELDRAISAVDLAGLQYELLNDRTETASRSVSISPMHLAKGLEFRAVVVMACDDEIIPSQQRMEQAGDDSDLQEVYDTERHLLYVACTRARDRLLVTAVEPESEFLGDLGK